MRLGSRTKPEKIKEFNLDEVCRKRASNKKESYLIAKLHESLGNIEEAVNNIKCALFRNSMRWDDIREYLMLEERQFYNTFNNVSKTDLPSWVLGTNNDDDKSWKKARNKKNDEQHIFEKWVIGADITVINKRKALFLNPQKNKNKDNDSNKNHIY